MVQVFIILIAGLSEDIVVSMAMGNENKRVGEILGE